MPMNTKLTAGILVSFAVMLLVCAPGNAEKEDVDAIIDRFIEAVGGREKIDATDNLVYSGGTYEEGEYRSDGDASMSVARPWFKLVGDKNDPGDYMEGYDGAAWEWFADPGVVVRTVGAASAAIRHYAGVEHPLVDYGRKGSVAEFLGDSKLDGRTVHVIRLTRRDGFVEQFYIDAESSLINASSGKAPLHAFGKDVATITRIADYRDVDGLLVPHRFISVEMPSGRTISSMQWGRIAANQALPDGWFSPPSFSRTRLQHFIESLIGQRDDLRSVMWTHDEFVRSNPQADIADAVNVAGFQILKIGQVGTAVVLLEANAMRYPAHPGTRFGLGRAYQTAGEIAAARDEYRAALEADENHERSRRALAALEQSIPPDSPN